METQGKHVTPGCQSFPDGFRKVASDAWLFVWALTGTPKRTKVEQSPGAAGSGEQSIQSLCEQQPSMHADSSLLLLPQQACVPADDAVQQKDTAAQAPAAAPDTAGQSLRPLMVQYYSKTPSCLWLPTTAACMQQSAVWHSSTCAGLIHICS